MRPVALTNPIVEINPANINVVVTESNKTPWSGNWPMTKNNNEIRNKIIKKLCNFMRGNVKRRKMIKKMLPNVAMALVSESHTIKLIDESHEIIKQISLMFAIITFMP